MKQQAQQQHPAQPPTEILGNTVDPHWHFAVQTVPTRCSMTVPGGLPFGFVVQPFAAPEDSTRCGQHSHTRCVSTLHAGMPRQLILVERITFNCVNAVC